METHIMPALLAVSSVGQTITKNTSVSIALVVMLIGATVWATTAFTSTEFRLSNMEDDIYEIKINQASILEAVIK